MINDTNGSQNNGGSAMNDALNRAQQAQQSQQAQDTGAKQDQAAPMFSLTNMGNLMKFPLGLNPASEILSRLQKVVDEKYTRLDPNYTLRCVPIDQNNSTEISISVLVITLTKANDKSAPVAYHTLLLEGSIDPIPVITENYNGQQVNVIRVVGDGADARLRGAVVGELTRSFGSRSFYSADSCVVPRGFNIEDENLVHRLLANAIIACSTELQSRDPNTQELNLAKMGNDNNLAVQVKYDGQQQIDAVGMPIRSDIELTFSAVSNNRGAPTNKSLHAALEENIVLTTATGFVDLIWAEDPAANNVFNQYAFNPQGMPPMTRKYAARLVLTSLSSQRLLTLPAILLALAAALSLRNSNAWFNAFRPRNYVGGDTIDIRDIGAIGYEVGVPDGNGGVVYDRINTKTDSFRTENLAKLISAFFVPGLVVSIDVPECGPSSWYLSVFAAAGGSGKSAPRAREAIIKAANTLTNGNFSKYFKGGPICTDENNRIHAGYYENRAGERRDLRDVDAIAILNMTGGKDQNASRDWTDTHQQTAYPLNQRLAARYRIMEAIRAVSVVNGFYRRITMMENFNEALLMGIADCNMSIRPANSQEMMDYERASYGFLNSAIMSSQNSTLFNASSVGTGDGMGAGGYGMRW